MAHFFSKMNLIFLQEKKLNKIENKLFEKKKKSTRIAPLNLNKAQCYKTLQLILLSEAYHKVEQLKVALLR
jgi:hypothetical protein